MGFEPTTSSMPSRRAPNCATAPPVTHCNNASIARVGTSTLRRQILAYPYLLRFSPEGKAVKNTDLCAECHGPVLLLLT